MRTIHVFGITVGVLAVLAFSRCGPIASSTPKEDQALGASASVEPAPQVYNLATVESSAPVTADPGSSAIAEASQWVAVALTEDQEQAQLAALKNSGKIYIPAELGDPNKVKVVITINQTPDQISSQGIGSLRLIKGKDSGGPYLTIASSTGIASSIKDSATAVTVLHE